MTNEPADNNGDMDLRDAIEQERAEEAERERVMWATLGETDGDMGWE